MNTVASPPPFFVLIEFALPPHIFRFLSPETLFVECTSPALQAVDAIPKLFRSVLSFAGNLLVLGFT